MCSADAACLCEYGQLRYNDGLVIGEPIQESIFHSDDWHYHLSKLSAESSWPAETLAAGEAVVVRLIFARAYPRLLGTGIHLVLAIYCKDLYRSLSTTGTPTDQSIIADVRLFNMYFDTKQLHWRV